MGNLVGVFSQENTSEGHTETHRSSFFPYKQVGEMVIMNDLEWPMLSYYVIQYEKFSKVMHGKEQVALTTGIFWYHCIYTGIKRKPYGWQVSEERLLELWPQPYHPRPQVESDAAGVTTRGVHPHAPVNHIVFFLCHGFIKFMYVNKISMKTRL